MCETPPDESTTDGLPPYCRRIFPLLDRLLTTINEYVAEHPEVTPEDVTQALEELGILVDDQAHGELS